MLSIFRQFDGWSLLDVALLSLIIYNILILMRGTRAAQMMSGVVLVVGTFILANVLPLSTLRWVMNKFYSSFIIILVIIFQDDIRIVLRRMGFRSKMLQSEQELSDSLIRDLVDSASSLSKHRLGGLIVFERTIVLSHYIEGGVSLDAKISEKIISSIFNLKSPIHDGAIIIQSGRIAAAACFLPLAKDPSLEPTLGTRHRAAIGITQETDAIALVISEVTGQLSIAFEGKLHKNLSSDECSSFLFEHLQAQIGLPQRAGRALNMFGRGRP